MFYYQTLQPFLGYPAWPALTIPRLSIEHRHILGGTAVRLCSYATWKDRSMNLLGVDVGFSANSKTTGLAWRVNGEIGSCRTRVSWDDRKRALPPGIAFSIAALDAPVLPEHEGRPHRGCESVFYGGAFWNRCRPGLSHYGRNFLLANQIVRFAFGPTLWHLR